ncbi:M23 family metallopeptidase [Paenibacillus apiarius]|uniref:M23 family metallopeptidase n=1 Tax=Paenibacillus apiarius TaxID=46240 RepID=A0ABT4DRM3_9BACL|nr:M23 family metallopeptidase [Paenibacillus apiarius]MCY9515268.1 M23 family metallopeptidase [Paenibacillus apiarius]MCY9520017.1 M23 family metallopeptidase [Paenibacillus apiarius]MCY9554360.1 M23 family metallopeptidase [Paenibacillus apiarius]MCY9558151.1 M23 family metallopeptidase [Paenibacillus apiarius]MCY9684946.1 M23 family metallopeptidase [Paenibacillus apiarius]
MVRRLVIVFALIALSFAPLSATASAASTYHWPVPDSTRITQGFKGNAHKGIDIGGRRAGVAGDTIVAFYGGRVARAGWSTSYGWVVYIHHSINHTNYQSRYAHMNKAPVVSTNNNVGKGTKLGEMGSSGQAQGVHLHFETRKCSGACLTDNSSTAVDPISNFFPGYKNNVPASTAPVEKADHDNELEVFYSMEEIRDMSMEERVAKGIPFESIT